MSQALVAKMGALSTTCSAGSQKSSYLSGGRSVSAPRRLVTSNAPTALGGRGRGRTPLHIVAARVAGVEIPNSKKLETSLTYIYGIGPTMSKKIMANTSIENKRVKDLSEEELTALRKEVEEGDYLIEGDLRRFTAMNIKRLIEIQCYRGKRHQMSLPVRGQKTKTNARTRKGKKKTVAGKKK
mmetsp:Transcript_32025/g.69153  ORF Transcript_32025/g.69153 Transcript_32025/m.69153 type:complete len:183 (-) Transcript_32025:144-692(-)